MSEERDVMAKIQFSRHPPLKLTSYIQPGARHLCRSEDVQKRLKHTIVVSVQND